MRIIFVTQYDEIHSSIILKGLIEAGHEISAVITSETLIHKKSFLKSVQEVIKKSGFRYFLMRAWEGIYIRYYEYFKLIGFDKFRKYSPQRVRDVIKKHNLKHISVYDINSNNSSEAIKKLNPDIIVCCVFNQIFEKELVSIPKYGCINIHRSLLPKYRGVSPTFWVLANNEKTTGITIHEMAKDIDAGAILAQKKVNILENDTVNTLSFRLMEHGSVLLNSFLEKIGQKNPGKKIEPKKGKYYSWPSKKAVTQFIKNNRKVL